MATEKHSTSHPSAAPAWQALADELHALVEGDLVVDASMLHGLATATFEVAAVPEQIRDALANGSGRLMGRVDYMSTLVARLRGVLASGAQPS